MKNRHIVRIRSTEAEMKAPREYVIRRLLQRSQSQNFDEARRLYGTILPLTPEAYDVKQYVDRMRKYFSIRGIENPTTEQLLELIPPERRKTVGIYEQYRLRQLWEKPGTIDTLRTKKRIRTTQNPKEGQTWYKKRRRVQTTLARSDSYKDPYERT